MINIERVFLDIRFGLMSDFTNEFAALDSFK